MKFEDMLSDMNEALINEFSEVAIINNQFRADVVIDKDAEQFGNFDTRGVTRRHEVTFLNSQVRNPKRGHVLETKTSRFELDGEISNDGQISRWHINEL